MTEAVQPTKKFTTQQIELCLERTRCTSLSFMKKKLDPNGRLYAASILDSYYVIPQNSGFVIVPEYKILDAYSKAQEVRLAAK